MATMRTIDTHTHVLTQDPNNPVRGDVNLFNTVKIHLELGGVDQAQAQDLVDRFKRR